MESVRIIEIPECKMVSSGVGMFGDGTLEKFDEWFSALPNSIYPKDFLYWDSSSEEKLGFHWLYLYEEGLNVPAEFDIIDFRGGLYAVATGIDQQTDMDTMKAEIHAFLLQHGFCWDETRPSLGHVITSPITRETLGYDQMNYWFPIKAK